MHSAASADFSLSVSPLVALWKHLIPSRGSHRDHLSFVVINPDSQRQWSWPKRNH